jgi:hypothetical protein
MNKQRRHFLDHDKGAILKRHLIDKVPVSDLCDELDLHPNCTFRNFLNISKGSYVLVVRLLAGRRT